MLKFKLVPPENAFMSLLLEADPSEVSVRKYLENSCCYVAEQSDKTVGICVLNAIDNGNVELFNIAVSPTVQGKGVGTALLEHVIKSVKARGVSCIELGTGTFGYQLSFYQRLGFRVDSIVKDFFIDNYDQPIFEAGIQHKDMLRLVLML
ncbi:GNAT family N-acetyltransferase [Photobacterium lipolyticum]|uniref:GNAT family N-acetyltransferase n=2 Tax=Photobacterium lipolyticum TaxID=266810 RepID=A0A2T3N0M2_9GAMM|nr:GNAT family N-acetyltransferase [Photobacterium lipolyticum]